MPEATWRTPPMESNNHAHDPVVDIPRRDLQDRED
jgi:hypothetical protein